jgi:cell shape-determining protein MreC
MIDQKQVTSSVAASGVVILFFVADFFLHLSFIRIPWSWTVDKVLPIEMFLSGIIHYPGRVAGNFFKSQQQIEALQARNAELRAQVGGSEFLRQENEELRSVIEKMASASSQINRQIVARVISSSGEMTIDHGSTDGIQEKDLVFSNGVLIGQVGKTEEYFSQINLIEFGSLSIVAQTQAGVKGVLKFDGNNVVLDQVGVDRMVTTTDTIFTSGSSEMKIPPGLYLGFVSEVLQSPGMPTQQAKIDQGVKISDLRLVQIVKIEDVR